MVELTIGRSNVQKAGQIRPGGVDPSHLERGAADDQRPQHRPVPRLVNAGHDHRGADYTTAPEERKSAK